MIWLSIAVAVLAGLPMEANDMTTEATQELAIVPQSEIAALISGMTLEGQNPQRFVESFNADGTWQISMEARAAYIRAGTWSVKHGMVCVLTDEIGERCRHILRTSDGAYKIQNYVILQEPVAVTIDKTR